MVKKTWKLQVFGWEKRWIITHTYPAWSNPYRAFWQYNENGTIVAMPGFNFALGQLARFREEKKIHVTVKGVIVTTNENYQYKTIINVWK